MIQLVIFNVQLWTLLALSGENKRNVWKAKFSAHYISLKIKLVMMDISEVCSWFCLLSP